MNYINYILSKELKELSKRDFKRHSWTKRDYAENDPDLKPIYYNQSVFETKGLNREDSYGKILLNEAIVELLNNGANPFMKDEDDHMVLTYILISPYWLASHKELVLDRINKDLIEQLDKKDMNKLFIKLSENIEVFHNPEGIDVLDKIFTKGITYHQGDSVLAEEIIQLTNGKLEFFQLLSDRVPSFNFNLEYNVNENIKTTLTEVGNKYLEKPKPQFLGANTIENTIAFVKSYSLHMKIAENSVSQDKATKKNKI